MLRCTSPIFRTAFCFAKLGSKLCYNKITSYV